MTGSPESEATELVTRFMAFPEPVRVRLIRAVLEWVESEETPTPVDALVRAIEAESREEGR